MNVLKVFLGPTDLKLMLFGRPLKFEAHCLARQDRPFTRRTTYKYETIELDFPGSSCETKSFIIRDIFFRSTRR